MNRPEEVFYISPGRIDDQRLDEALFDGPGWYHWGGRVPDGDVEGPFNTKAEARQSAERRP